MLAATVTVLFSFAAGVMDLWQAERLKRKHPSRPPSQYPAVRLPSLEWLQTVNARALVASMLLTGLAVPSAVVAVGYGRGCRIRRVRVPAAREPQETEAVGALILSRRVLAEQRGQQPQV